MRFIKQLLCSHKKTRKIPTIGWGLPRDGYAYICEKCNKILINKK